MVSHNSYISKAHLKNSSHIKLKRPNWIRVKAPISDGYNDSRLLVKKLNLNTVCQEAACPNIGECWEKKHVTIMILGKVCTRKCTFCNISTGIPDKVDSTEPIRLAKAISALELKHVVITSVDRDDLKDGGSIIWAETVNAIRDLNPKTTIETLIPDFKGETENIDRIIEVAPEVVSHNLETVRRLTKEVRVQAKYDRSLDVLKYLKDNGINRTKSGIMLGLGEEKHEVLETLNDLINVGVDIVTLGQYLQPSIKHLPVNSFISPEEFKEYEIIANEMGFRHVESGPLVRSSYKAHKHVL
mgnify:CR=1 FL=1